jgi:hypothetical protein
MTSEADDSRFGSGIMATGQGTQPSARQSRDINDLAASALFSKLLHSNPATQEGSLEVHIDDLVPGSVVDFLKLVRGVKRAPRNIHKDIQTAESFHGLSDGGLNRGSLTDVHHRSQGRVGSVESSEGAGDHLLRDIGHNHPGPFREEGFAEMPAQAAGCPCDEYDLVSKSHPVSLSRLRPLPAPN